MRDRSPEEGAGFSLGEVDGNVSLSPGNGQELHVSVLVDWHGGKIVASVDLFENLVLQYLVGEVVTDLVFFVEVIIGLRALHVGVLVVLPQHTLDEILDLAQGGFRLPIVQLVVVDGIVHQFGVGTHVVV